MVMRSSDRAIDVMNVPVDVALGIRLLLHGLKETWPDTSFLPAIEAACPGTPTPIALGQITPWSTGTQNPQDAIDDASMDQSRSTGWRFLRRKQRFEPLPLRVGQPRLSPYQLPCAGKWVSISVGS